MDYQKIEKKAKKSWRVSRIIGFIIMLAIFLPGLYFGIVADILPTPIMIVSIIIFILYNICAIILYPEIEYRQWRYLITDEKVEIRHGIFYIKTITVPVIRIQHITTSQGPINRMFGLHKISISLASGSFEIEGLSKVTATMISENLKNKLYNRMDERGELS